MRLIYTYFALATLCLLGSSTAQAQALPLGSALPMSGTTVTQADGSSVTIGSLTGDKGTVFIFWSNQCPWIDKYQSRILDLQQAFSGQGIRFVVINANDATAFPKESAAEGARLGLPMPYVMDAGSSFARALGAERTPHIYVFDGNDTLVYIGTIDDSPGDPANVQKTYLHDALTALVQGKAISVAQTKAFGCTIKFPNP